MFWTILTYIGFGLAIVLVLALICGFTAKKIGEKRGLDMSYDWKTRRVGKKED